MESLGQYNLIGDSPAFRRACEQIKKFATVDAPVFLSGETGTGKELAARAIHYLGARRNHAFVPVNCGALPEALLESELFGHERGAFTDAKSSAAGLVSEANEGTLFLDEVDALSLKAQAALLRFLQDKTYRRVGGGGMRQADVRVVTASNAKLEQLVKARQFRQDLWYRLSVLGLQMPALRERGEDAVKLAKIFLTRYKQQYGLHIGGLHAEAEQFIKQYAWPGNVRELENVIHRESLMCETPLLQLAGGHAATPPTNQVAFKAAKAKAVEQFERLYLSDLLERSEGNISRAARLAGQDRSAFGRLVRKHGLMRTKEVE